jgi:hypothetical protein
MSTLKSSAEDLTLNADGSGNDVIIQSDGSTKAIVTAEGTVGIGVTPESWNSGWKTLQIGDGASIAGRTVAGNVDISSNAYRDLTDNRWEYIGANGSEEAAKYTQFDGTHVFYTAPAGSADAAITFSTKATIDTDGLKFNGDTAAANALDDYEEGTFTPALSGMTTAGNTAYAGQAGFYEKIGRTVHIRGSVEVSSKGTIDGLVLVTGLPFTAATTTQRSCIHLGYADHFSITASESISGTVMSNDTTFLLRVWGDTGGTVNMDDARLSDSSDFYFSGTYYV